MGLDSQHRDAPRRPHRLTVQFGDPCLPPDRSAETINISPLGMFLSTSQVVPAGRYLWFEVELPDKTIHLQGVVMWSRERPEPEYEERRPGFGVRLLHAPSDWFEFQKRLPKPPPSGLDTGMFASLLS